MNKKQCTKCKTRKDRKEFHKHKREKDGLNPWCKACCREYRQSKKGKAALARYARSDKFKATKKRFSKTEKGKASSKKGAVVWRKQNPEKRQAQIKIQIEIKAERMPRVNTQFCVCGAPAQDYHHPDYSRPLDVIALCRPCHVRLHNEHA